MIQSTLKQSENHKLNWLNPQHFSVILVIALSLFAWFLLWYWGQSPNSRYLQHQSLVYTFKHPAFFLLFILSWLLMTMAMMLPTTLPLIKLFQKLIRPQKKQGQLFTLLIVGYLTIWIIFGLLVYLLDGAFHIFVAYSPWLNNSSWVFASLILVVAGIYQFTPLKYQCLDKCRSPLSFVTAHWRGGSARQEAFLLGISHGLFCLGCCWSLMLVMFALGMGNFGWMLLLAVVMAAEKTFKWGKYLRTPLGLGLIVWGWALIWLAKPM